MEIAEIKKSSDSYGCIYFIEGGKRDDEMEIYIFESDSSAEEAFKELKEELEDHPNDGFAVRKGKMIIWGSDKDVINDAIK